MKAEKKKYPSVHRGIVRAALFLLELEQKPAASWFSQQDVELLADETILPDQKGDRQNGRGLHYYCVLSGDGTAANRIYGVFANGRGNPAPSLLTMYEGSLYAARLCRDAGKRKAALKHLARAAHMLADSCCPPHTCRFTYFSRYAAVHKRYEALAAALFWGTDLPVKDEVPASKRWASYAVGAVWELMPLEALAQRSAGERISALSTDVSVLEASIRKQLIVTIQAVAALFSGFAEEPHGSLPRGQLWCEGLNTPLFPQILQLEPDDQGQFLLADESGQTLSLTESGQFAMEPNTGERAVRVWLGMEQRSVFFLGDQSQLLGICGNRLCLLRRPRHETAAFRSRTAFRLVLPNKN